MRGLATAHIMRRLVALVSLGLCACRGGEQAGSAASNAPSTTISSGQSPAKPTNRPQGIGVEDLRLIPEDSALVFGLDLAQLKTSAIWAAVVQPELERPDVGEALNRFEATCGFDPMSAVANIVGNDGYWNDVPEAVTIMRLTDGVTKDSLTTCLKKLFASANGMELIDHREDLYTFEAAPNWYALKFLDDSTVVVVAGPRVTSDRIRERLADSGLHLSPAFSGLVHRLDLRAPAWALVDLHSKALQIVGSLDSDARAAYAKLSLSDGMRFEVRVRMPSREAAEKAATPRALPEVSINALAMTHEGQDLVITATPSQLELAAFVSRFRAFVQQAEASASGVDPAPR